jgi:IS5 family transposase
VLGKQEDDTGLFQCVTMEALVPSGHMLRRVKAVLDLGNVVAAVEPVYAKVGRPSIDPEVVARMWVLQYLYGLSERQLCDEMQMHAGFRWFCGLSFNDPVPDQSTLVKLRTDKWAGTDFWDRLLRETVRACEAAGICNRSRMGVDGTQITANAATVSLEERRPQLTVDEAAPAPPAAGTDNEPGGQEPPPLHVEPGGRAQARRKSGDPDWHGEKFSNATHVSATDPQARLYRKGKNQEAKLRYLGHYLADLPSGVIYGAMATQATGTAEREAALALLEALPSRCAELVADLAYRDGEFLAEVLMLGVQPIVSIGDEPQEAEPVWQKPTRDVERMRLRLKQLRAARAKNATRLASAGPRAVKAQRQRTRLEHLYAEAKGVHGLARARGRGLVRVDQQVKLTAAVQNLKRLLSARPKRKSAMAQELAAHTVTDVVSMARTRRRMGNRRPPYGFKPYAAGLTGRRIRKSDSSSGF